MVDSHHIKAIEEGYGVVPESSLFPPLAPDATETALRVVGLILKSGTEGIQQFQSRVAYSAINSHN